MTETPATIRVLCVDDNRLVGDALGLRIRQSPGFEWLGQLFSADELLQRIGDLRPDIIILDVDMPGSSPFEAMRIIGAQHPDVRIVMLSGHIRRELVEEALDAGAWGYLSKDDGPERLLSALREVHSGQMVLSRDAAAVLDS